MENGLNFGKAIEAAKAGKRVARAGWNGAGMFAHSSCITISCYYRRCKEYWGEGNFVPYRAYWALKTAQEDVATWAPSGSDSLAEDWSILD
jgi:hypothetical protein